MSFKKQIPNLITFLNLTAGLLALIHAFNGSYNEAFSLVCLGIFFDFWDGFFARIYNAQSALGVQLDSLADMVTSGVVPGVVMYKMLSDIQENQDIYTLTPETNYMAIVPYIGFIITIASCYRLAKFNIDTRQTDSFIGLPTPANALLIMSIPMILFANQFEWLSDILSNPFFLVGLSFLSAYLLNAEIPLFSLKVKYFSWEKNKLQVFFLAVCVILLVAFQYLAIPLIILFYVLLSVINNKVLNKQV
ncbi:CDP-diacylglycerol--serine O-phosphatidyltransferase [Flavobacterium enshiense DK69]|uniref:Phosphatidylserine synthase n=1 Tax=Flavobacterium enshiense DK69 TaxID=1107311 RepID=V6S6E1_9FLAO|nr:CDP-alcohol phosphatidyltransferase family protein [Flavobacterium enshiense]ESU22196.1 CDP-diacylglycerol--serine O-phosphatidyltransferase [Flavobacterium enshiense DK69]KGO97210.1 phosphatidylserine synthase [Flavobacterium enshiense DK69]